jgi:hypothetical protein
LSDPERLRVRRRQVEVKAMGKGMIIGSPKGNPGGIAPPGMTQVLVTFDYTFSGNT